MLKIFLITISILFTFSGCIYNPFLEHSHIHHNGYYNSHNHNDIILIKEVKKIPINYNQNNCCTNNCRFKTTCSNNCN